VALQEDAEGAFHLLGLSVNAAPSEEEALNLLFLGDTNRVVAETPLNDSSTRSHCMFVVNVESREPGQAKYRRAKLHFVDLAGSERVSKTKVDGRILQESRGINQSLHYLEQVIVALHERSRGIRSHVPYRNSVMTSVLRDSLGGNCRTSMLATINMDPAFVEESVSSCRFAQRVALVKNAAHVNEEVDPSLVIKQLKARIASLEEELGVLKGAEVDSIVTSEEREILRGKVLAYIEREDAGLICGSMAKIREAFSVFREICLSNSAVSTDVKTEVSKDENSDRNKDELKALVKEPKKDITRDPEHVASVVGKNIVSILLDRAQAFEAFRKVCPGKAAEISEADKQLLRKLCEEGKALGEAGSKARAEISRGKQKMESMRVVDAMKSVDGTVDEDGAEYVKVRKFIEDQLYLYNESTDKLRVIKLEIDRIQRIANRNKERIQKEFEDWFEAVRAQVDLEKAKQTTGADALDQQFQDYYRMRDEIINS
jgi:kinesin family protein 6/9